MANKNIYSASIVVPAGEIHELAPMPQAHLHAAHAVEMVASTRLAHNDARLDRARELGGQKLDGGTACAAQVIFAISAAKIRRTRVGRAGHDDNCGERHGCVCSWSAARACRQRHHKRPPNLGAFQPPMHKLPRLRSGSRRACRQPCRAGMRRDLWCTPLQRRPAPVTLRVVSGLRCTTRLATDADGERDGEGQHHNRAKKPTRRHKVVALDLRSVIRRSAHVLRAWPIFLVRRKARSTTPSRSMSACVLAANAASASTGPSSSPVRPRASTCVHALSACQMKPHASGLECERRRLLGWDEGRQHADSRARLHACLRVRGAPSSSCAFRHCARAASAKMR